MTGLEPAFSSIGSNRAVDCATTTATSKYFFAQVDRQKVKATYFILIRCDKLLLPAFKFLPNESASWNVGIATTRPRAIRRKEVGEKVLKITVEREEASGADVINKVHKIIKESQIAWWRCL